MRLTDFSLALSETPKTGFVATRSILFTIQMYRLPKNIADEKADKKVVTGGWGRAQTTPKSMHYPELKVFCLFFLYSL